MAENLQFQAKTIEKHTCESREKKDNLYGAPEKNALLQCGLLIADGGVWAALAQQGTHIPDDQIEGGDVKQGEHGGSQKPEAYANCHRDEELGLETAFKQ